MDYYVFAASEGNDQIALIRFGPSGIRVERTTTTGIMPSDIDGPHGVALSPDGRFYYVTTAHGTPFGVLWKYATANDSLAGRVMLGNCPATAPPARPGRSSTLGRPRYSVSARHTGWCTAAIFTASC